MSFAVPNLLGPSHPAPHIWPVNQGLLIAHTGERGLATGGRATAHVFPCACPHPATPRALRT